LGGVGGNLLLELPEFGCHHRSEVGLHCRHLRADLPSELGSFVQCHRPKEGLHFLHFRFGGFRQGSVWTVPGIVSFLLASVTRLSYVDSVLPSQGVSHFHSAGSASYRVNL